MISNMICSIINLLCSTRVMLVCCASCQSRSRGTQTSCSIPCGTTSGGLALPIPRTHEGPPSICRYRLWRMSNTRRPNSGGIALRGRHPVKHWSVTQPTSALSSGEADLGGICRGASLALGLQSPGRYLSIELHLYIYTDATAAIGICRRRCLDNTRYLCVSDLWVQDRLKRKDFTLTKVAGADNQADLLT